MDRKKQIREIFAYLKSTGRIHTQQDFAKAIGASKASVSNMMNGNEQYLTDNLFRKIGYFFGDIFSKEWLETGEGDMLVSQSIGNIEKSTVVGNNVKGNGIHINNAPESEAIALLREQLAAKDAEIQRLHSIIDRLLDKQ